MRLFDQLRGKRDILVPYFTFRTVAGADLASPTFKEIGKLRFEVYCLERNFLAARDYAEGMETDEYDRWSVHVAAYTLENDIVGTVRLVQPEQGQPFPWEGHCQPFDALALPAHGSAAEISRLVVRKTHRRRRGDSMEGVSRDFVEKGSTAAIGPPSGAREQRGNSPLLLLGMYRAMYRYSRANGIRYWYAAMERSLARSLEKMGFKFVPIGPQVDYYGPVTPHMVDLDDLIARLETENKFLAAWFDDKPIPFWIMLKTMVGDVLASRVRRRQGPSGKP